MVQNRVEVTRHRIDVLVFLDVGMEPSIVTWAMARLAPIQVRDLTGILTGDLTRPWRVSRPSNESSQTSSNLSSQIVICFYSHTLISSPSYTSTHPLLQPLSHTSFRTTSHSHPLQIPPDVFVGSSCHHRHLPPHGLFHLLGRVSYRPRRIRTHTHARQVKFPVKFPVKSRFKSPVKR